MGDIIGLHSRALKPSRRPAASNRAASRREARSTLQIHSVDKDAWLVLEQRMPLAIALKIMRLIDR